MHPSEPAAEPRWTIDFEPVGRRVRIPEGSTLLEAARASGVGIASLCGGEGWCESCIVRLESGACSPPTESERTAFTDRQLADGFRLACQAVPASDIKVYIPPESLTAPQRLQVEGEEKPVEFDPILRGFDLDLKPPNLTDLRSDAGRTADALADLLPEPVRFSHGLLETLSTTLRSSEWKLRIVLHGSQAIAALPVGTRLFGLAVDVGTTKLAAYLVDLETGSTAAKRGAMNPQIAYGEDVISRLAFAIGEAQGAARLQGVLIEALNELLAALCVEAGAAVEQVLYAVMVGNTAMHHLLAGLPVRQLALAPYVPVVDAPLETTAERLGLRMNPGARVHLLPNLAGYVGADHAAALLATRLWEAPGPAMLIDIGTNTEISLAAGGRVYACSCASGPAFEGAHIRNGMRAAPGAIERIQITDGAPHVATIENQPPVGICGSGILDAVAELHRSGIVDRRGAFLPGSAGVIASDAPIASTARAGIGAEFLLVAAEQTGHGQPITISRSDVNEIQLAKAAIRTGVDILLETAGLGPDDLERILVAGAFGTYINLASAIRIGMLPELPLERFSQIGNAAGLGARQALTSRRCQDEITAAARAVHYIELSVHPRFQKIYLSNMYFPAGSGGVTSPTD